MKPINKSLKSPYSMDAIDPNLWDRLVWQQAFDRALKEKNSKQNKDAHSIKNISNLRTH